MYEINYDDERFQQVEAEKQQALTEVDRTYSGMISNSDKYYQDQINASKDWANTQQQLQQDKTDFAIEQIEQQKEQANKDYKKEQSGAYVDWQKQSNQYGVNAEQMAASGLTNTGFSESSQVSMYNTYQNRVATARESYNLAVLNYNNSIKDAQLQNNSALAEIAYTALQQQLELSLQGFQYKNQLIEQQLTKKLEVDNTYYNRYQDVLQQMNTENALAEEIRQYNESLKLQKEQMAEEIRQYEKSYALQEREFNEQIRQFDEEMARLKAKDAREHALELQRLELQKQQLAQQKAQADREYQLQLQQMRAKQSQISNTARISSSPSGTSNVTSKSSVSNAKNTGMKVANVLTSQYASALGLSPSASIVQSNGKYYAKEGGNYVDLSPITSVINATKKVTQYAGFTYGTK